MIINYFIQCRKRKFFKSITYILIFAFTFMTGSCVTTYEGKVNPVSVKYEISNNITAAIMKSGLVVNLKNKDAMYVGDYLEHGSVILYSTIDSTGFIKIKDIQSVMVEKEEVNPGLTVLATLGVLAVLAGFATAIYMATKESCPFIYSFDGEKFVFDGEPYGGAITESLTKTDFSRLENLKPVDGKYKLLMRNEADETQHTDEMKLLVIDHPVNTEVAPDIKGNMSVFGKNFPPLSVTDETGKDMSIFFNKKDNIQWQTDMPDEMAFDTSKLRNELVLKFPKPKGAKNVKLLVNAGTGLWGGYMIKLMLNLRGNKVDQWYDSLNKKGSELMKLHQFIEREELYLLKVNVLENEKWTTRGMISPGGPFIDEDRIIDLNIENVTGDTLCIKLNPPFGFWKIDYAGVIYESMSPVNITELNASNALNEKGIDMKAVMSTIDGKYYEMPDSASIATIEFTVPAPALKDMNRSLFLKTTGYYDIHLKKDKPEQTELLEEIFNTPGSVILFSMNEYYKKLKSLGVVNK